MEFSVQFKEFFETELTEFVKPNMAVADQEQGRRGKMLLLHLCSVDDAGHRGGYKNPMYFESARTADRVVARIHAMMSKEFTGEQLESTAFIVTGDHGTKRDGMSNFNKIYGLSIFFICRKGALINKKVLHWTLVIMP